MPKIVKEQLNDLYEEGKELDMSSMENTEIMEDNNIREKAEEFLKENYPIHKNYKDLNGVLVQFAQSLEEKSVSDEEVDNKAFDLFIGCAGDMSKYRARDLAVELAKWMREKLSIKAESTGEKEFNIELIKLSIRVFEKKNNCSIFVNIHGDGSFGVQEFWDEDFLAHDLHTVEQLINYLENTQLEMNKDGKSLKKN